MNKNSLLLLKTLLKSTSQWNIYKHCKDKKKKGRIVGNSIGIGILFLLLMAYCIGTAIGYGMLGLASLIPETCAVTIAILAFFLTMFKTNGYLFNFKEYDMLMSLPFEPKTVAGCKFLYMYVKSLLWYVSISVAMMIGYGYYERPSIIVYPIWLILSLLLPVIPMLIASFLGYLIARISAGFKKRNIIQTILILAFTILCMSSRFIIDSVIREGKVEQTLESVSQTMENASKIYLPAGWFSGAVKDLGISDMLLLIAATVLLFEVIFILVGRSYRQINSKLKSHAASKQFKMTSQKVRSVQGTIAYKEFRRMTGSANYLVNCGLGELLCLIFGIVALFLDFDRIIGSVTQGAPVTKEMLYPAIPLIVYFFIGMVATTAITPSLEGKNYWIVQSLPITKKTLYQGKMLFNLYLTIPFSVFSTICLCISSRMPLITAILSILLSICLCAFSTAWGCVCGIKHIRLDWENEMEIIKQSSAVAIYMFPNMFINMGLIVFTVFLGTKMNHNLILGILIAAISILAGLSYRKAVSFK